MKRLLFAVTAIVAFSMLAPSAVIAEPTHPNEVGLYFENEDGTGPTGAFGIGIPLNVYLVLTKPTDTMSGAPYPTINAFECRLDFNPIGNMFKLGEVYPGNHVNVGDNANIGLGYLEYVVGFASDVPVTDESVVLLMIVFMHTAEGVIEVTLGPTEGGQSIPGEMAFQSVPGQLRVMYSMGGSHDAPVFLFEGIAIAVEEESFGSVKALYR